MGLGFRVSEPLSSRYEGWGAAGTYTMKDW